MMFWRGGEKASENGRTKIYARCVSQPERKRIGKFAMPYFKID